MKDLLDNRKSTHGPFKSYAICAQALKDKVLPGIEDPVLKEAMDMILGKIARIAAGNEAFEDHWEDVAGYATRAIEYLKTPTELPSDRVYARAKE